MSRSHLEGASSDLSPAATRCVGGRPALERQAYIRFQPSTSRWSPDLSSGHPSPPHLLISFIHPSTHKSVHPSISSPVCLFVHLSICQSIHPHIHLSVHPSICPSDHPFFHLSVRVIIHLSIRLSIRLSIYASISGARHRARWARTQGKRVVESSHVRGA